jgi:hypothetical protein
MNKAAIFRDGPPTPDLNFYVGTAGHLPSKGEIVSVLNGKTSVEYSARVISVNHVTMTYSVVAIEPLPGFEEA